MIYSYCKKCKQESPGDMCQSCGKRAAATAQRDIWSIAAVPLADSRAWMAALYALLCVVGLLLLLIFGLEAMLSGSVKAARLWNSSLPQLVFSILPLGLLITFLFLMGQGREVNVYVMDPHGAHLQTWHQPSRIKSWTRLQSFDPAKDVPQQDGSVMHLSQERHMLWQDVQSVKYKPGKAVIHLYHTPHCAPMVLRLPPEEYELAAAYVGKYCKGK